MIENGSHELNTKPEFMHFVIETNRFLQRTNDTHIDEALGWAQFQLRSVKANCLLTKDTKVEYGRFEIKKSTEELPELETISKNTPVSLSIKGQQKYDEVEGRPEVLYTLQDSLVVKEHEAGLFLPTSLPLEQLELAKSYPIKTLPDQVEKTKQELLNQATTIVKLAALVGNSDSSKDDFLINAKQFLEITEEQQLEYANKYIIDKYISDIEGLISMAKGVLYSQLLTATDGYLLSALRENLDKEDINYSDVLIKILQNTPIEIDSKELVGSYV